MAVLTDQLIKHANLVGRPFIGQAKKNDAVMRASFAKDLLSESSIISNQNASVDLGNL